MTNYTICGVQWKIKMQNSLLKWYWYFQINENITLNQVWDSSKHRFLSVHTGHQLMKLALLPTTEMLISTLVPHPVRESCRKPGARNISFSFKNDPPNAGWFECWKEKDGENEDYTYTLVNSVKCEERRISVKLSEPWTVSWEKEKSWDTERANISWRSNGKCWNDLSVRVCCEITYLNYVIWGQF